MMVSDEPRTIRMSETEWGVFELIGGVQWLKSRLRHMHKAGYAKRQRNNRIRKDHEEGLNIAVLAEKYQLDKTTIWRILK
jgi:Mor family transcriptional regulator